MIDDSSLPTTRVDREAWLLARQNDIATRTRAALRRIVVGAFNAWADTLTADAGDLSALDTIPSQWMTYVDTLTDDLGEVYQAGQMTAWLGLPFQPTPEFAAQWTGVVNENAASYMTQASNRLAHVGTQAWTNVRAKVHAAVVGGNTNEELKRAIEDVTSFSEYRADTIARTETVGAYVQGDMAGAEALGDQGPIEKVWVAAIDRRTRESHVAVHNTVVPFTQNFPVGGVWMNAPHAPGAPAGEVVNCVLEGERVLPIGPLVSVARAWWEGEAVEFVTADGERLRVTPNHPVLTPVGWKPAQQLQPGDDVLRVQPVHGPDHQHRPPRVEQLYDACRVLGLPVVVEAGRVDFHGDRPHGEVEVVGADRVLWDRVGWEHLLDVTLDGMLNPEGMGASGSRGDGTAEALIAKVVTYSTDHPASRSNDGQRTLTRAPSVVGGSGTRSSFRWRHTSSPAKVRFGPAAGLQAEHSHASQDGGPGHAVVAGECQDAGPVVVQTAQVVEVNRFGWAGHVFNLHSGTGLLYSAAAVHSNCRCYVEFLYAGDTRPDGTLAGEKFTIDQLEKSLGVTPAAEPPAVAMPSTRPPAQLTAPRDRLAKGESRSPGLNPPTLTAEQRSHLKGSNLPVDGDTAAMVRAKQKVQADLRERMGDRVTMGKWTVDDLGDENMVWTAELDRSGRPIGGIWPNAQVSEIMRMTDGSPRTLRYQSAWRDGLTNVHDNGRSYLAWRGTDPKLIEELKQERVRDLVAQWAGTSNDQNPISLALQETARREFGLDDALDWTELDDFTRQKVVQELADHGDEYTAFVHAQYDATQAWLASEGVTEMRVYRGMHWYTPNGIEDAPGWVNPLATQTPGYSGWDVNGVTSVPLRPLSSFTWNYDQAVQFAGGDIRLILDGVIPADRIFATPLTGVGCLNEHEIVILAGDGTWKVTGTVVR